MIIYKRGGNIIRKTHVRRLHHIHKSHMKDHRGHGIFDFFKPVMDFLKPAVNVVKTIAGNKELTSQIGKTASDIVNIGRNTKGIITSLRNKKAQVIQQVPEVIRPALDSQLENVISRLNRLKAGSGFRYD